MSMTLRKRQSDQKAGMLSHGKTAYQPGCNGGWGRSTLCFAWHVSQEKFANANNNSPPPKKEEQMFGAEDLEENFCQLNSVLGLCIGELILFALQTWYWRNEEGEKHEVLTRTVECVLNSVCFCVQKCWDEKFVSSEKFANREKISLQLFSPNSFAIESMSWEKMTCDNATQVMNCLHLAFGKKSCPWPPRQRRWTENSVAEFVMRSANTGIQWCGCFCRTEINWEDFIT